ncbi:DNA primase [Bacteroides sp. 224]|uniref:DNA primase n=1 Tax=Bacteroides sp. 224 TaxID=2302936 RepID=UPI0013D11EF3|nr:DNA primase [Bacteroides sp. 224]NDV66361.1 DNA primase [Bacteroides sp. 224]
MIDQATVDRIIDAAQIVDVVSEFVTLRKRGVNYVGLCPFHNEKTASFSVSPAKGLCKCFSCGKGGNSIHFIMEHEQLSYYEALKYLAKKYNIEIKERELTNEEKQVQSIRESMFVVNQYARDYFQEILKNHIDGRSIGMAYFRQRGFRDDIIDKFQLGFSIDERDAFAQEALKKGYKKEFLIKTGLCYETEDNKLRDRFRGRVIFPVHTLSGKVVAFGGRILSTENKKLAKYVNSPESEIYHKSNELYGIYFAKQSIVKQDRCFLVEGYTDVISMHQSGVENVVSSSGTSLTPGQIRLIHRFTNNITVLYDGDMAGIKASIRGIDMLLEEGMNIKVVLLPDGDDPDSFARKHNATDFQAYIAAHEVDFIRFKINLLMEDAQKDPIKQAALISDIVKSISIVPESIMRDVYTRESARQLKVEEKLLVREVAKMLASQHDKANRPAADANPAPETEQPPMTPSPDAYQSLIPQEGTENQEFYKFERLILQMVIRYGERIICSIPDEEGNEVPISVIQYIADDLRADEISLHHPLHIKIFNEAVNQIQKEGFIAERYFTSYPDPEIAKFSTELASERYQLSNIHSKTQKILSEEERLLEIVPMLLINYKGAIIRTEIKYISSALQDPAVYNDVEKCQNTLKRYKELHEILRVIEKQEGDRVILLL